MAGILTRKEGRAGHITLTRPEALNALDYEMCLAIEAALDEWRNDPEVALILIDAEGPRAFCAGGDIAQIYHRGRAGDYTLGRTFWRDEYRMNAKLADYPKPVVSLMHGFVMGGGVGIGCHLSHRIVGETTQMAMPECGIGLIPDVGGTHLLARAPGRLGDYLGLSGARMTAADALHAGFADTFVPEADWPALKAALIETGDAGAITGFARPAPDSPLAAQQALIDSLFSAETLAGVLEALAQDGSDFAAATLKTLRRNSPLSMACTFAMVRSPQAAGSLRTALVQELRATWRLLEQGDFLEGVRAQIIEKDRTPRWKHDSIAAVTPELVAAILAPLGAEELNLEEELG